MAEKSIIMDDVKQMLSEEELLYVENKCNKYIEKVRDVSSNEQVMFMPAFRKKRRFLHYNIWQLTGNIDRGRIMSNYTQFLRSNDLFRTTYLYKKTEHPVALVHSYKDIYFDIADITPHSDEKKLKYIQGVSQLESRKEYNPENDFIIKMRAFIVDEDKMILMIGVYPHKDIAKGIHGIIEEIFSDMQIGKDPIAVIDEKVSEEISNEARDKSLKYFNERVAPIGKSLRIMGELKKKKKLFQNEHDSLEYVVDDKLIEGIKQFCKKKDVSYFSVWLYSWGKTLGSYNSEKKPVVLVKNNVGNLEGYPIKVDKDVVDLNEKMKINEACTFCNFEEICDDLGVASKDFFHVLFNFEEIDDEEIVGNKIIKNRNNPRLFTAKL